MISTRDRQFYERSLADLDRELAAGDLTEADHRRLRADYERRLRGEGPPPRPPVRRGFLAASIAFVVVVAVAAGVLVAQAAGRRDAGDTLTGEDVNGEAAPTASSLVPATSLPEDLARCTTLGATEAIDCFITYTTAHPDDPEGFIQFGIFSISAGMQSDREELFSAGEEFLREALELDPDSVVARVYLAVLLDRTGRAAEAVAECDRLASADIPSDLAPLVDLACR